jgi:hypothetical protein
VKLHQVSPNGSPLRAARNVTDAAMASQAMANPQAGMPYSSANACRQGRRKGSVPAPPVTASPSG